MTLPLTNTTPPTPPSCSTSSSYRLLYRGALSLPDSNLTLDGITFCACIDTPSKNRHSSQTPNGSHHSSDSLLKNPLALALESMRGRPTLRFVGRVRLSDVWMDKSGGVLMDIHPRAILTRVYFENVFCLGMCATQVVRNVLNPSTSKQKGKEKEVKIPEISDLGVKIALGDSDGPETTYMVVFAKLEAQRSVQLAVARLTIRPPDPQPRPRPDDPIPRKPPLFSFASKVVSTRTQKLKRAGSSGSLNCANSGRELKRIASIGKLAGSAAKKPKLDMRGGFKVPDMPVSAEGKGKTRQIADDDVFGLNLINGEKNHDTIHGENEVEKTNKNIIKRIALDFLAKTKDPGRATSVSRSHPEFKEIFQWVYRGVSFALRVRMRSAIVDAAVVNCLVKTHVEMYVSGHGSLNEAETPNG
ncbi:hypothetical protein AX15_006615 [Amanita polypyramis BW_CC]|nr:hypothetical protein AX15_006615 [Amanita polypyramis BW_CC]